MDVYIFRAPLKIWLFCGVSIYCKKYLKILDCKTVRILFFAYSSKHGQSNKKSGTRLKTESETEGRC